MAVTTVNLKKMSQKKEVFKKPYKFCMVPYCSNTTVSAPEKNYICVPHETNIRNKWLEATNRNWKDILPTEVVYCCEDHFDLPNDVENWNKNQKTPTKLILRKGVVPHRFNCQNNRSLKRKKPNDDVDIKKEIQTVGNCIEDGIKVYKLDKFVINLDYDKCSEHNQILERINDQNVDIIKLDKRVLYTENHASTSGQFQIANTQQQEINTETQDIFLIKLLETNIQLIKENSNFYVGIPEKYIFIVDLLSKKLNVPEQEILLCLKKIRRDINILPLANDFGVSQLTAENCLLNVIPKLARYFNRFIFWPKSDKIFKNLPRPFRRKYKNVESVINCLEITRPEPGDNPTKFDCWSPEQNKYIYRYLISSTPDGLINFVSRGFGGSRTDNYLMEKSGYLDVMPFGKAVMINEGFLDVANLLHRKRSQLFWPPKMIEYKSDMFNNKYIEQTKKSIIIKMCTEQVLKRFREFLILYSNTCLHPKMIPLIDDIVVIIGGLMNLQNVLYEKELMYLRK